MTEFCFTTVSGTNEVVITVISLNCFIGEDMPKSVNYRLCYENLVTYRAMLTFGKTAICTCCRYCLVNNFGMTLFFNYLIYAMSTLTAKLLAARGSTGCIGKNCFAIRMSYLFIDKITAITLIPMVSVVILRNIVCMSYMTERLFYHIITYCTNLGVVFGSSINIGNMSFLCTLDTAAVCTYVPVTVFIGRPI